MARHCNNCGQYSDDAQTHCVFCGEKFGGLNGGIATAHFLDDDFFESFFGDDIFGGGGFFDGIFGGRGFNISGNPFGGFSFLDPFGGGAGGRGGTRAGIFSINLNDIFGSGSGRNDSRRAEYDERDEYVDHNERAEYAARETKNDRMRGGDGGGDKFEYIKNPLQKHERALNEKINIVVGGDGRRINPQSDKYEAHKLRLVFELEDEMLLSRLNEYQREQRLMQRLNFCAAHRLCPKCLERTEGDGCPFCRGADD
jgi:hypothetical protein